MSGFLVAQLGARRHYAIPLMLHRHGMLDTFYTDFCLKQTAYEWMKSANDLLPRRPFRQALRRHVAELPDARIRSFPALGVEYALRRRRARTPGARDETFLLGEQGFAARVLSQGFGGADGAYVFNTAGVELLREARRAGLTTVMEQTIAPRVVQRALMATERALHPGWEPDIATHGAEQEIIDREAEEWSLSDVVLCGSEFVRDGIGEAGVRTANCRVVPYGFEPRHHPAGTDADDLIAAPVNRPLRVVTVGGVGLRKGTPYILEAAARLRGAATFRLVGPITASPEALANLPDNVELTGAKPFAEVIEDYLWADVFLLPSLCEGSAGSIYEAMSFGLPIICTANCGSVVRAGVEGFIVPIRDAEAIATLVHQLADDRYALMDMGRRARARARDFTLDGYRRRHFEALTGIVPTCQAGAPPAGRG